MQYINYMLKTSSLSRAARVKHYSRIRPSLQESKYNRQSETNTMTYLHLLEKRNVYIMSIYKAKLLRANRTLLTNLSYTD